MPVAVQAFGGLLTNAKRGESCNLRPLPKGFQAPTPRSTSYHR